jgi:hypothetical protein
MIRGFSPAALQNAGPVEIEYKCLVPIYVFPEMRLRTAQPPYIQNRIKMFCENWDRGLSPNYVIL